MTGRVRVVVATTEGPSTVLRVTWEDPALRSVVCLGRTTATLPISRAYDAFVRAPTGVVERAVGHPVFRVDVSAAIDDGDSWQLGLYLAHRLKAEGRLAEDDAPADLIVWATGAVDGDLAVRPVERVADKRRRSEAMFASARTPVLAVLPAGQGDAFGDSAGGVEVLEVATVTPVLERLGLGARGRRRRPLLWAAGAVLAAAAVVLGLETLPPERVADAPPVTAAAVPAAVPASGATGTRQFDAAAIRLVLLERRTADGAECAAVERLEPVAPGAETPPGACGIAVRAVHDGAIEGFVWLLAVAEGGFREYAGNTRSLEIAAGPLAPGEAAEVRVSAPSWVRRPVVFRILLVLADAERPVVSQVLAGVDLMSSADLDRLTGQFLDLGLDVRTFRHRIVPPA